MTLRCKPGDLAVLIKSAMPENIGALVTCVEFMGTIEGRDPWGRTGTVHNAWRVEPAGKVKVKVGPGHVATGLWAARDSDLRPIRPEPGEDQTIEWAGYPADVFTKEEA